jgi:DNA-binding XRE family transcriptional regulator
MDINKIAQMHIVQGKTFAEIGTEYGVSKQAVHSFYQRNKNQLDALAIDPKSSFIDQLKFKRRKHGISQLDLAQRIGIDQSHIARIENGQYKKSKYIDQIKDLLEIT